MHDEAINRTFSNLEKCTRSQLCFWRALKWLQKHHCGQFSSSYEHKKQKLIPTEAILMTIFSEENKESIMHPPFTARTVLDDT